MSSAQVNPVLNYGSKRRRSKWWLVWLALLLVLGAGFYFQHTILAFINEHVIVYRLYRAQNACVAASTHVGEVVLRTDGRADGIRNAAPYAPWPGRPISISKPVVRGSPEYRQLLNVSQQVAGPVTIAIPGFPSGALSSLDGFATPLDCSMRKSNSGEQLLGWITVKAIGGSEVEVIARTTVASTVLQVPSPKRFAGAFKMVEFIPEAGPLIVRRIAADRPQDVRIAFEHVGGVNELIAEWSNDHYVLKLGPRASVYPPSLPEQIRLLPVGSEPPTVESEVLSGDLPELETDYLVPPDPIDAKILGDHYFERSLNAMQNVDVYDFKLHHWSKPLENPFGASFLCVSPDGRLVCCGSNRWCVLDSQTGDLMATLFDIQRGWGPDERAIFSPDSRWLTIAAGGEVYLFDFSNRTAPRRMRVNRHTTTPFPRAVFTSDSKRLVIVQGGRLRSVDLEKLKNAGI